MSQKTFLKVTSVIFSLIALIHLARLVLGWQAQIGGWTVPSWLSVLAILVTGYLGYQACKLSKA